MLKLRTIYVSLLMLLSLNYVVGLNGNRECKRWQSVELDNYQRYDNNSFLWNGRWYPSDHLIITNNEVRYCICNFEYCISKCCPEGSGYSENFTCATNQEEFSVEDLDYYKMNDPQNVTKVQQLPEDNFYVVHHPIKNTCQSYMLKSDEYKILDNGSLIKRSIKQNRWLVYPLDKYCVEYFENTKEITSFICVASGGSSLQFFGPTRKPTIHPDAEFNPLYKRFMFVSLTFLAATFLIYCILSEANNLVAKSILSQIAMLGLAYIFLINLYNRDMAKSGYILCPVIGTMVVARQWTY